VFEIDISDPFGFEAQTEHITTLHAAESPIKRPIDVKHLLFDSLESVAASPDAVDPLSNALAQWNNLLAQGASAPKQLVYLLDETYVDESNEDRLNIDALVGSDLRRGQALESACDMAGFLFFICYFSKEGDAAEDEEDEDEEYGYDICDDLGAPEPEHRKKVSYQINSLVNTQGRNVLESVSAWNDDVVQKDYNSRIGLGADQAPSAFLILPETHFVPFMEAALEESESSTTHILPYMRQEWRASQPAQPALNRLHRVCTTLITKREERLRKSALVVSIGNEYALHVAAVCAETGDQELFRRGLECI